MTENPEEQEEPIEEADAASDQNDEEAQEQQAEQNQADDVSQDLSPEQKVVELEDQLAQAQNQYLRSLAELENYRKRVSRERGEQLRFAAGDTLRGLFPILDNFRMGLQAAEQEGADSIVSPEGESFDPLLHEALSKEVKEDVAEGTILTVLRRGYRLHDRVLRAPQVVVAASEASEQEEAEAQTTEEEE